MVFKLGEKGSPILWHLSGMGAAGVSAPPHLAWHPRVVPGAAPQSSPPSPGSILVPAPCGTSSSLFPKHLSPLLTVPRCQGIRQAMCSLITAPLDVFEDACQYGAPLAISRKLWLTPYKQGSIIYGPSEALKVVGVIEVHLRHSIQHALFFHPSSAFCAVQCGKTEDFIYHYQFLINPPMAFHLIINVEELIQGVGQHFWSVALMQNVLILQGAAWWAS